MPAVELVYVHVEVAVALETALQDTVKPVLGSIKEENETSPVKPRLVTVMVDRPQGAIYGGSVAAPAFQKIVGWAVPYFGISPK